MLGYWNVSNFRAASWVGWVHKWNNSSPWSKQYETWTPWAYKMSSFEIRSGKSPNPEKCSVLFSKPVFFANSHFIHNIPFQVVLFSPDIKSSLTAVRKILDGSLSEVSWTNYSTYENTSILACIVRCPKSEFLLNSSRFRLIFTLPLKGCALKALGMFPTASTRSVKKWSLLSQPFQFLSAFSWKSFLLPLLWFYWNVWMVMHWNILVLQQLHILSKFIKQM